MSEPLDEAYFEWLYSQVAEPNVRLLTRSHRRLATLLFKTEFVWIVANDDNRMEDGRDLRPEFVSETGIDEPEHEWFTIGCSMLEMLIGLARRLSWADESDEDASVREWFWHLMANLGLRVFTDAQLVGAEAEEYVTNILEEVIWRNYESNGRGGLFPLKHPQHDQRGVELWYQLSSYLIEGNVAC